MCAFTGVYVSCWFFVVDFFNRRNVRRKYQEGFWRNVGEELSKLWTFLRPGGGGGCKTAWCVKAYLNTPTAYWSATRLFKDQVAPHCHSGLAIAYRNGHLKERREEQQQKD